MCNGLNMIAIIFVITHGKSLQKNAAHATNTFTGMGCVENGRTTVSVIALLCTRMPLTQHTHIFTGMRYGLKMAEPLLASLHENAAHSTHSHNHWHAMDWKWQNHCWRHCVTLHKNAAHCVISLYGHQNIFLSTYMIEPDFKMWFHNLEKFSPWDLIMVFHISNLWPFHSPCTTFVLFSCFYFLF